MQKIVRYAINNKYAFLLIILSLSFIGLFLYNKLPQDVFPNAVFPRIVITVSSQYTPVDKMLFDVVKPLEDEIKTVHGVEEVRSSTGVGNSKIDIYFSWDTDPYRAYELTSANISRISNQLPPNTTFDVKLMSPSAFSIANYALVSENTSEEDLTAMATYIIKPKMLSVKGVYNVALQGDKYKTLDIFLNTTNMYSYGITENDISSALNNRTKTEFLGGVNSSGKNLITFFYSRPNDIKDILNIPIKTANDKTVYIKDVASVVNGSYPVLAMVKINEHKSSVILNVFRDDQSNSIEVINNIDEVMKEAEKNLPKGVSLMKPPQSRALRYLRRF